MREAILSGSAARGNLAARRLSEDQCAQRARRFDGGATILDKALALAQQGFPVFPCNIDKTPALRRGFLSARREPVQVGRFWWEDRLIGVPTGSSSNIVVLDIDIQHG